MTRLSTRLENNPSSAHFHRLPKRCALRRQWLAKCRRPATQNKQASGGGRDFKMLRQGTMASAEREPITGAWGRSPQRGPEAEPLVRGSGGEAPLKPKAFQLLDVQQKRQICLIVVGTASFHRSKFYPGGTPVWALGGPKRQIFGNYETDGHSLEQTSYYFQHKAHLSCA